MQSLYKIKILIVIFAILSSINIQAATSNEKPDSTFQELKNKSIYGTAGFFPIYLIANINFEVKLASKRRNIAHYIGLKSSGGVWETMTGTGQQLGLGLAILSGKKAHHFEVYIGATSIFDTERYHRHKDYPINFPDLQPVLFKDYIFIWPATAIGYRYQKPQKPFLLRLGAGYPDAVYLSLGYAFN